MPELIGAGGKRLRTGYTTGTCAAAAAAAAARLLFWGVCPDQVEVELPGGKKAVFGVGGGRREGGAAHCWVVKDAGDDPDVTGGMAVWATVRPAPGGVVVRGGPGVGVVTRPGLSVPPGKPAINPVPREMIAKAVEAVLPPGSGAEVIISVPGGEEVAKKTMNPRLGIVGGISILGTTGLVVPLSQKACRDALVLQAAQAVALGFFDVVLTPGRKGEKLAVERYGLPAEAVVQTGNYAGHLLSECARLGVKRVILFGHLGKLVKVAAGVFQTHSRTADARRETLVAHAALEGAPREVLRLLWEAGTAEEAAQIIKGAGLERVFCRLAEEAARRAEEYTGGRLQAGAVLTSLKGEVLGCSEKAVLIGESLGWRGLR